MTTTATGKTAEQKVQSWLNASGFHVTRASYFAPFDLYTDAGTSIEVKCGNPALIKRGVWGWHFNIHRHGKRKVGSSVDIFVLRVEMGAGLFRQLGMGSACHFIVPSSEMDGLLTVRMTVRSIITRFAKYFNNFEAIRVSDLAKTAGDLRDTKIRALIANNWEASARYDAAQKEGV
jgi:hypothetical protein